LNSLFEFIFLVFFCYFLFLGLNSSTIGTMKKLEKVNALLENASLAVQERRLAEAKDILKQVLDIDPDNLNALDQAGFVWFFLGKPDVAETYCLRALELNPDRPYALLGLGICQGRMGRLEDGVKWLERAIEVQPRWSDPYWDLSVMLNRAGHVERAQNVVQRAISVAPEPPKPFEALAKKLDGIQRRDR
jgi:tetratricopeptide (TPR) repeat protein